MKYENIRKKWEEFVKIYGSLNLIWEITDIKNDIQHDYLYVLDLIEGDFIKKNLPWIPECLIFKTEFSKIEDPNEINETTPLL